MGALKMKLKGGRSETVSDIKRELQPVLYSMELLKCGQKDGVAIYIHKEIILKEMAAPIE
jgi:hypothetical protein